MTSFSNGTFTSYRPVLIKDVCFNHKGHSVAQGEYYRPGHDVCLICSCINGEPKLCKTSYCAPPPNCKYHRVIDTCCEWICEDNVDPNLNNHLSMFNFHLLVCSAILFSFTLFLFLVYRLKKKRIRNRQNRQMSQDDMSMNSIGDMERGDNFASIIYPPETTQQSTMSNYWNALAWWKPKPHNVFENRPPPPSYDDAMQNQPQQDNELSSENPSMESGRSEAPPYSEIHMDPVICESINLPSQSQINTSQRHHQLPCGAALVLPVPPPGIDTLHHIDVNHDDKTKNINTSSNNTNIYHRESRRNPQSSTLPSSLRRLRARSREGIVLPNNEDVNLTIRQQYNLSRSSSSLEPTNRSSSTTLNTTANLLNHHSRSASCDANTHRNRL